MGFNPSKSRSAPSFVGSFAVPPAPANRQFSLADFAGNVFNPDAGAAYLNGASCQNTPLVFGPRVFGSVVSGTDTDESELDLLVDPGPSTSLLAIAGLKIDAEKCLECRYRF